MEGSLLGGRYDIRSCLGRGGAGVVYQAYDRVLEETVAIKVLLGQGTPDSSSARRFLSEIKLARKVSHPNVCRIHDYGEDGGRPYISMQFVEGVNLRARVRGRAGLPVAEAYDVALQIAEGLQAIHDAGVVHRDLKSANVMIDSRGVARVMDFGLAKATEGGESLTGTGHIVGTAEYMSPEQIHSQPLDARTDVYALGVILFELFTGRVPFTADTAVGTFMKHLHDEPPLESPEASAVPPAARGVIRTALAKERDRRYGSAREVADALRLARTADATPAGRGETATATWPGLPEPTVVATATEVAQRPTGRGWKALVSAGALLAFPFAFWVAYKVLAPALSPSPAPPSLPLPSPSPAAPSFVPAPRPTSTPPARGDARPTPSEALPGLDASLRGCEQGQAAGCMAAGQRYESGDGVARNERLAAELYRRACDHALATACTNLGVLHNSGRGVEKDVALASELYGKACEGGDGAGCNNLGTLYEFGLIGIGRDETRAAGYYRRGCDLGDAPACGNLAIVLLGDPGLRGAQREEALRLLRQGCERGTARACRRLRELALVPTG